jgi:NADPH2:quinone reductase
MSANRVVMTGPGPPDVLRYENYKPPAPGAHNVLLRRTAIGLNYIDIQRRTGRCKLPHYPSPIGTEAAGIIEAVGGAASDLAPGERVAYSSFPIGAYADRRSMLVDRLVKPPMVCRTT